jgi:hypothetical protein
MQSLQKKILTLACAAATIGLTACSTNSSGFAGSGNAGGESTYTIAPSATAAKVGSVVSQTGGAISDAGVLIGTTPTPIPGIAATQQDVGSTVSSGGNIVSTAGNVISNGAGSIGSTANPIGNTVAGPGSVVSATGATVTSGGELVANIGADGSPLASLKALTTPVGSGIVSAGTAIEDAGQQLSAALSSGPAAAVTQQLSSALLPTLGTVAATFQSNFGETALGQPLAGALKTVGSGIASGGAQIGAGTDNILVQDVGGIVTTTGAAVSSVALIIAADAPAGGGDSAGTGLPALPGGLGAPALPGAGSPVEQVTAALSGAPLTPMTSMLPSLSGGASPLAAVSAALSGGASPLAPLTGALSGAGTASVLAPLTGALGNISR